MNTQNGLFLLLLLLTVPLSSCASLWMRAEAKDREKNISPCLYPSIKGHELLLTSGVNLYVATSIVSMPFDLVFDTAMLPIDLPYLGKRKWDEHFWKTIITQNDMSQPDWLYDFHLSYAGKRACDEIVCEDMKKKSQGQYIRREDGSSYYDPQTPQNGKIPIEMLQFLHEKKAYHFNYLQDYLDASLRERKDNGKK